MIPKPTRVEDKEYLEFIWQQDCVVGIDCWGDIVGAHLNSAGSGGSDYSRIPMCVGHHTGGMGITKNLHNTPIEEFEKIYHVNLWKDAHRLFERYTSNRIGELIELFD